MKGISIILIFFVSCAAPEQKKEIEIQQVSLGVAEVEDYPKYLSYWKLFAEPLGELKPVSKSTFPYEINAPLFTDYAHKARFIHLPEGGKIQYDSEEVLDFPVGTVLIKNFFYPDKFSDPNEKRTMLETRLLIHEKKGWNAVVYEWNDEQTDAKRVILGKKKEVEWRDEQGELQLVKYKIPSQPQCKSCHDLAGKMTPIGPSARQLNRDDQLDQWREQGWLKVAQEEKFPRLVNYMDEKEPLDLRARAWLEVNCAHCHRREGPAKNSGLYLSASQKDSYRLGVNKPPIAAGKGSGGLKYSIVPGSPDQSILVHRIESLEPGEMMPELGRTIIHKEGVQLIKDWIAQME